MGPAAPQTLDDVEPEVAEPILASQLVDVQVLDELFDCLRSIEPKKKRSESGLLCSTVKSLDNALEGGLECGRIVAVHSEAGAGGGELCRKLLVDSLLRYDRSTVAIIDTTGNFDILRLYTLILGRLKSSPNAISTLGSTTETAEDVSAKILDRVKVMRVFDFVGVKEAVSETRESLEDEEKVTSKEKDRGESATAKESQLDDVEAPAKRNFVADSEDEEDDDEMLFDSRNLATQPEPAAQESDSSHQNKLKITPQTQQHNNDDDSGSHTTTTTTTTTTLKLILIDNLAQAINPLLKKDYVQTNALVSEFLHDLAHLTRTHALHTILLNPAAAPKSISPTRQIPRNLAHPTGPQKQHQQPPPSPSIFASATAIPSLMSVLGPYMDVGLLVTRMPKKERDARVYYSDAGEGQNSVAEGRKRRAELLSVLEVIIDRWGRRVGAWGAFAGGESGIENVV